MGFMDDLKSRLAAQIAQVASQKNPQLVGLINELMVNRPTAGLPDLVDAFEKQGLAYLMNSWVSSGQNLPITPQQIESVLGSDKIQKFAAGAGISPDQVKQLLAQHLPQIVDQLTPNGRPPATP